MSRKIKNYMALKRLKMIRSLWFFVFGLVFLSGAVVVSRVEAAAGINSQINFQGKVVNSDGTNVANVAYDFVFKIYTVDSGGSPVWTESRTGGDQVTVTDGIF